MTRSRAVASVLADAEGCVWGEITAWRRTGRVQGATHPLADLPFERDAARGRRVCPAHAHEIRRDRDGERIRYAAGRRAREFGLMEVDAERGAAGAATGAVIVVHS